MKEPLINSPFDEQSSWPFVRIDQKSVDQTPYKTSDINMICTEAEARMQS